MSETREVPPAAVVELERRRKRFGIALAAFLGIGIPFVVMATLVLLAYDGIYFEPFRLLWIAWPSDLVKELLGFAVFFGTIVVLELARRRYAWAKKAIA